MAPSVADAAVHPISDIAMKEDENSKIEFALDIRQKSMSKGADNPQGEKQILVDPASLKKTSSESLIRESKLSFPPSASKQKFASFSLPNSPASSPRFGSSFFKKIWRNDSYDSAASSPLGYLTRSKSSCEGSESRHLDDNELALHRDVAAEFNHRLSGGSPRVVAGKGKLPKNGKKSNSSKCGSCLYLPSFGKAKPVRSKQFHEDIEHVISRRVSLEKFECGSWASCPMPNDIVEDDIHEDSHEFFDLPQELIKGGVNDAISPVRTAFVFDKDPKGILKSDSNRNSCESTSRHVRFSTSCPSSPTSCISPHLQKARDDFNAFLEAQAA